MNFHFFSYRIVSVQLIEHMFMLAYQSKIKLYFLEEKASQPKILWLLVVSICNLPLYGQDGKAVHMTHIFFMMLLTIIISNFPNHQKVDISYTFLDLVN